MSKRRLSHFIPEGCPTPTAKTSTRPTGRDPNRSTTKQQIINRKLPSRNPSCTLPLIQKIQITPKWAL